MKHKIKHVFVTDDISADPVRGRKRAVSFLSGCFLHHCLRKGGGGQALSAACCQACEPQLLVKSRNGHPK